MSLNQKAEFKIKFRIQTIMKSNEFPFLSGIQLSDPILMEIDFFLAIRCNQELAGQILSKSKVPRFSSEFFSEFQLIEVL
jgi:hypothetical protein